jgi:hypothetical protein
MSCVKYTPRLWSWQTVQLDEEFGHANAAPKWRSLGMLAELSQSPTSRSLQPDYGGGSRWVGRTSDALGVLANLPPMFIRDSVECSRRLQNVSTAMVDSWGLVWTAVEESE